AQGGGDRLLVAVGDRQLRGERAQDAAEALRFREHRRRRVDALSQGLLERFRAGAEGGLLAVGRAFGLARGDDPFGALVVLALCLVEFGGEAAAVGVAVVGDVLDLAVLLPCPTRAGAGLLGGGGEPVDFLAGRGGAARGGVDHAAQPGEALGAARGGPGGVGEPAFGGGERVLRHGPFRDGLRERLAAVGEPFGQA